jgi:hypothetical protein
LNQVIYIGVDYVSSQLSWCQFYSWGIIISWLGQMVFEHPIPARQQAAPWLPPVHDAALIARGQVQLPDGNIGKLPPLARICRAADAWGEKKRKQKRSK